MCVEREGENRREDTHLFTENAITFWSVAFRIDTHIQLFEQ